MSDEIKPAYLISGSDEAKIATARRRLRERAHREGGESALEVFEGGDGRRGPDAEALIGALAMLSLAGGRRYLLADCVESWGAGDAGRVAEALGSLPPETTVVLVAHGTPPAKLAPAVKKAGGEALSYSEPKKGELPRRLVADAKARGFSLDADAARLLVERIGSSQLRLQGELDRLALWAGEGGSVGVADLEEMVADTSEAAIWSLSDAIADGDAPAAMAIAERLAGQGEAVTRILYSLAPRLRQARRAAAELDAGRTPKQVADGLSMHPYAAKMLVSRVSGRSPAELEAAVTAIADLEVWCRGGADYDEEVALTIALRSATAGRSDAAEKDLAA